MLVNADGEVFMNPLETRDVAAASIIRECTERGKGVRTPAGQAVWLDTPMIELKNGEGTIEKRIPAMLRMFGKYGIDIDSRNIGRNLWNSPAAIIIPRRLYRKSQNRHIFIIRGFRNR